MTGATGAVRLVLGLEDRATTPLKGAAAAARELSEETADAEVQLRETGRQAGRAAPATARLGSAFGGTAEAAGKARGALSLLAPALGELAGGLADASDLFEVLSGGGASWLTVAGPVAAAAAALALVHHQLAAELAAAEEVQSRSAAAAEAEVGLYQRLEEERVALAVATGRLSEAEAAQLRAQTSWREAAQEGSRVLEEQRKLLQERLAPGILDTALSFYGLRERVDQVARSVAGLAGWLAPLAKLWVRDEEEAERLRLELAALEQKQAGLNRTAQAGVETTLALASAQAEAGKSVAAMAPRVAAARQEVDELTRAWAALGELRPVDPLGLGGGAAYDLVVGGAKGEQSLSERRSESRQAAVAETGADLRAWVEARRATGEAVASLGQLQTDIDQQLSRLSRLEVEIAEERAAQVGAGAELLLAGDGGALSVAAGRAAGAVLGGPTGAVMGGAAGSAVSALSAFGAQGAGGVEASLSAFTDGLAAAFKELPALLGEVLPGFAADLVSELVLGMAQNADEIVLGLARLAGQLVLLPFALGAQLLGALGDWWADIGGLKGLARAVGEGLRDWWADVWARIRDWFADLLPGREDRRSLREVGRDTWDWVVKGERAAGGVIAEDGLYWMHRAEQVIPATGVGTQVAEARAGGGRQVVEHHWHLGPGLLLGRPEDLAREVDRLSRRGINL